VKDLTRELAGLARALGHSARIQIVNPTALHPLREFLATAESPERSRLSRRA
jgi:hypothetical protein